MCDAMAQHTAFLMDNIGSNRVTLDIRPNRFEEPYSYEPDCLEKEFKGIESVLDMFCAARGQRKPRPKSPPEPQKRAVAAPEQEPPRRQDPGSALLYCVLVGLDPTLSLVEDKQLFVDKFRSELKDKARNFDTKLKRYGFTVDQAIKSVDEPSDALYRYISLLMEKSLMVEPSMDMYEMYGTKLCLVVNPEAGSSRTVPLAEAYSAMYESKARSHKATITLEKLNSLLVKDLKEIAESIGIETSKTEEGKRKNLLKSELRDKIKGKLFS